MQFNSKLRGQRDGENTLLSDSERAGLVAEKRRKCFWVGWDVFRSSEHLNLLRPAGWGAF